MVRYVNVTISSGIWVVAVEDLMLVRLQLRSLAFFLYSDLPIPLVKASSSWLEKC